MHSSPFGVFFVFCPALALFSSLFLFFTHPATTEIYTLSLHDALPICLEAKYEAKQEDKPKTEARTVTQSKAPAPISPLKGGKSAGVDVLVDTNGEFYGSYAQWKAARKANRIR